MKCWRWLPPILAAGLIVTLTGVASAARVPGARNEGQRSTGSRGDITVPYLTTGGSAFMKGSVAPRIYSSPIVDDPVNPQARPVFNLIFYGAQQSFGDRSNGAVPKQK
jgi:hypothetical protein